MASRPPTRESISKGIGARNREKSNVSASPPPDVNDLFHACTGCSGTVYQIDRVGSVDGALRSQHGADCRQFVVSDHKSSMQGLAAGFLELDFRRLVPNGELRSQPVNQHEHVNRIDGGIDAPPEDCSHIIARAPGERQLQPHLAPVFRDVFQPPARSPVTAERIERPAAQLVGNGRRKSHDERNTIRRI